MTQCWEFSALVQDECCPRGDPGHTAILALATAVSVCGTAIHGDTTAIFALHTAISPFNTANQPRRAQLSGLCPGSFLFCVQDECCPGGNQGAYGDSCACYGGFRVWYGDSRGYYGESRPAYGDFSI